MAMKLTKLAIQLTKFGVANCGSAITTVWATLEIQKLALPTIFSGLDWPMWWDGLRLCLARRRSSCETPPPCKYSSAACGPWEWTTGWPAITCACGSWFNEQYCSLTQYCFSGALIYASSLLWLVCVVIAMVGWGWISLIQKAALTCINQYIYRYQALSPILNYQ